MMLSGKRASFQHTPLRAGELQQAIIIQKCRLAARAEHPEAQPG